MHSLTNAQGVLSYLEDTQFAATSVRLLAGGHSAFTYRVILRYPLPTGDTSVILKHCEGYIAAHDTMKIEAERAVSFA
jgi:hypothetical protein